MGVTTALIGVLPTYASAGVAAPDAAGRVALRAGRGARRRMGRRSAALRRARRSAPARSQCLVGADGAVARHAARDRLDRARDLAARRRSFLAWGWRLPFFASVAAGRLRLVDPHRRAGNAAVPAARAREVAGTRAGRRSLPRALAQAPDRRRRAHRAGRAVFARRGVLALAISRRRSASRARWR